MGKTRLSQRFPFHQGEGPGLALVARRWQRTTRLQSCEARLGGTRREGLDSTRESTCNLVGFMGDINYSYYSYYSYDSTWLTKV
jgi:hypothetical protein